MCARKYDGVVIHIQVCAGWYINSYYISMCLECLFYNSFIHLRVCTNLCMTDWLDSCDSTKNWKYFPTFPPRLILPSIWGPRRDFGWEIAPRSMNRSPLSGTIRPFDRRWMLLDSKNASQTIARDHLLKTMASPQLPASDLISRSLSPTSREGFAASILQTQSCRIGKRMYICVGFVMITTPGIQNIIKQ